MVASQHNSIATHGAARQAMESTRHVADFPLQAARSARHEWRGSGVGSRTRMTERLGGTGGTVSRSEAVDRSLRARCAYVLLEVVISTGLLVVALSIIGAQIQDSGTSIRRMERKLTGVRLAEQYLAYMDMGLIDLDSVDEEQEGDFGPRHPDWGWRLTTEPTAVDGMYRLYLEILHHIREEEYREDDFPYDDADVVHTVYSLRPVPQAIDLAADFGLSDEELEKVSEKFQESGLQIDVASLNPALFANLEFEQLLEVLPVLLDSMNLDLGDLGAIIPPEILEQLKEEGLLGGEENEEGGT